MPYLFTRLNFEVPFTGAEYLNEADVSKVISGVEPQPGFVNWLFGTSDASLTSYDGTHVMTESDSSLVKTYGDNYVLLPANTGVLKNGLQTEYGDNNSYTMCGVIKYRAVNSAVLMGAGALLTGEAVQKSGSGVLVFAYRNTSGSVVANPIPLPAGIVDGDNIFIAVTRNGNSVIAFVGGAASKLTLSSAPKNVNADLKIGVGNTSYANESQPGFSKELQCYEFLYAATPKTASELDEIYAASKARCVKRGINII
ncbi:hypothetical protein [Klebsiella quasipneumoniae]|uniref:hypothetical protein n=1 Tax=Klebsiella quasipneumoniae TaxID=1463165 RepID=UPI00215876C3|nr:hypothetical protein [Klebsiella quasipneumoniae]HBW1582062.1 hypothetical protein [Klebsiella quasipneumoniae subsp. quasipneumoniae]MCR8551441.1 hypothetical protein [Klebsiella quasipneumoniae]HBW1725797.1 hypothetical protein [Klebsiella quasipneumoniae subsp. quasipneumoniae]HBW1727238.1 hypothetical protein [Klebsiella quasipneumoniae subsp. quasipneumoniae]HBW1817835.1 hypothetical protein [Klebsiella quasipneumoniae subsp. quasipneumoniae]